MICLAKNCQTRKVLSNELPNLAIHWLGSGRLAIHQIAFHRLNALPKQILMLLPLLLLLLLLLYVFHHALIRGREAPPYNYVINTYTEASAEAAEAGALKSVLAIHSIYEKLFNELPTYQVLPNELLSCVNLF